MLSRFVKEQHTYTKKQLDDIFTSAKSNDCIKKLKSYGILKTIKIADIYTDYSDLEDLEIIVDEDDNETECRYVFTFVGVIIINGIILKCYPKYIFSKSDPTDELKQVMQVLEKINSKEQIVKMYINNQKDNQFNRLATMVFFLVDYYENGVYNNSMDIIETNGAGEINWNKTINETFAILHAGRPYYTELQTIKHKNNDYDFFKRLHEVILTTCSKELEESSLLDLLGLLEVDLTSETIEDLGDKEYLLNQLEKEMSVQFNTRKISLLEAMYMFINDDGTLIDNSTLSLYGTNAFHVIWEKACASVMDNKLNKNLETEIDKPIWVDSTGEYHSALKTLIPDIISLYNDTFIIFDAKYYNITLEPGKPLSGNPGIGDVTKQYLYQLAFKNYIANKGYRYVKNCFLMPTESKVVINKGFVKLSMMSNIPFNDAGAKLEDIQIRLLPAQEVFNLYLTNQKYDIGMLCL